MQVTLAMEGPFTKAPEIGEDVGNLLSLIPGVRQPTIALLP
jgi:hypothetical protein